ncbi:putative ankyrin repeat protein RF_0381 [Aplysia californica]|uniref:Ankyrin repeat protein RF_0381 n=1 Tax=Aplysia californica TaxID=6500 RepID=A0ABM1A679_APLCA|nr:putative ankyrin repeat protein RF_0381 [Aplysia californica]
MLRFKPDALTPSGSPAGGREFDLRDLEDCFSEDLDPPRSGMYSQNSPPTGVSAKHVSLMEAEQGVKAALFNKLLVDQVVFDERLFYAQTALFLAAEYDSTDALEILSSAGADLDMEDMFGETALFVAVARGATGSVRWLISRGVDVNHKTPEGETALHMAAMTSSECVQILVEAGTEVNAPKTRGVTPLMVAAVNCSEAVACLIQHGADVNAKTIFGDTALIYAVRSGNVESVRLLVSLVDDIDYGGNTNLGYEFGFVKMDSPLVIAVEGGKSEIVRLLLEKGADVNSCVKNTQIHVLHLAVGNQNSLLVESSAANIPNSSSSSSSNSRNQNPKTRKDIVSSLIEHDACVDCRDKFGQTPLMVTAKNGDVDIMETLIEAGAELNALNSAGTSALYLAVIRQEVRSIELLMARGAVAGFELHQAVLMSERVVKTMVDCGAMPVLMPCRRLQQDRGVTHPVTPLYVALRYGALNIASFFISRGFLRTWDLKETARDYKIIQLLNEFKYYKGGVPPNLSNLFALHDLQSPVPCSLFLSAFVQVSTSLGFGPDRKDKIKDTGLPVPLQRSLMFQGPLTFPQDQDTGPVSDV